MAIDHARMRDVVHREESQEKAQKWNRESAEAGEGEREPGGREQAQKRRHEKIRKRKGLDAVVSGAQVPVTGPSEDDAAKSGPSEARGMRAHLSDGLLFLLGHVGNF